MPGKPKDPPGPAGPAAAADDGTGDSEIDERFTAIETEQREQRGILDKVLAAVTPGGAPPAPGATGSSGQDPAPAGLQLSDVQAQVRAEIEAADKRRRAEEDEATWRAGVSEVVETVKNERAPREPVSGIRGRLQALVIGRPE